MPTEAQDATNTTAESPEKTQETGTPFEFNQYHPGGIIRQLVEALGLQQQPPIEPTQPAQPTE
jgi:hypothetical protein